MSEQNKYKERLIQELNLHKKDIRTKIIQSFNQSVNDLDLETDYHNLVKILGKPKEFINEYIEAHDVYEKNQKLSLGNNLESEKRKAYAINLGVIIIGMSIFDMFDRIRVLFGSPNESNNEIMGNVALAVYFILVPILGGLVSGLITPIININEKMPRDIAFTGGMFHTFIAILWFNNYLIFIQNPLLILQSIFVISILIILILSYNFYSQKYSYRYGVNLRFRIQSN